MIWPLLRVWPLARDAAAKDPVECIERETQICMEMWRESFLGYFHSFSSRYQMTRDLRLQCNRASSVAGNATEQHLKDP
jgi:hypothetical protein